MYSSFNLILFYTKRQAFLQAVQALCTCCQSKKSCKKSLAVENKYYSKGCSCYLDNPDLCIGSCKAL